MEDLKQAMLVKLGESGLNSKDAAKLRLKTVSAAEANKMLERANPTERGGFVIPYFTLEGKPNCFFRVRYLGPRTGFAALATKEQRYSQPPGTGINLYMPPFADWRVTAADPTKPIVITEGELKAACACKHGFACLGLGGVESWHLKGSTALAPAFNAFVWTQRTVYICYDSDAASNPNVVAAENKLAAALTTAGAIPCVVRLPSLLPEAKTGLDDYLVSPNADLQHLLDQTEPWTLARELHQMNEEVAIAEREMQIIRLSDMELINPARFTGVMYAHRTHTVTVGDKERTVSAAQAWLKWPQRSTVAGLTYLPGAPRITASRHLNMWACHMPAPKRGVVKPFLNLVDHLLHEESDATRKWFLQWLAWPLQHPTQGKLVTAVMLFGGQGSGKSLMGTILVDLYGGAFEPSNAKRVNERTLEQRFNRWARNRQFILGEEITGTDNRQWANLLKDLITNQAIEIELKGVDSYTMPNFANFMFTSNSERALFLEEDDRRYFVAHCKQPNKPLAFYKEIDKWFREEGGLQHLRYYLENDVDLEGFDPAAAAPASSGKEAMRAAGRSALADWCHQLATDPATVLTSYSYSNLQPHYSLVSLEELMDVYRHHAESLDARAKLPTRPSFTTALHSAGIERAYKGMPVRLAGKDGPQHRLWMVQNRKVLERYNEGQLRDVYATERAVPKPKF